MSVKENLCIAPTLSKKYTKEDITDLCVEMLAKVWLKEKINEYPSKLSGGQKQRVAIARALMLSPDIMLFDEPTSSLDPELTGEVLQVIRELAKEHMTMVIVTHEIGFAREAANNVIFMDNGVILDAGSPEKVIQNPESESVKMFLDKVL